MARVVLESGSVASLSPRASRPTGHIYLPLTKSCSRVALPRSRGLRRIPSSSSSSSSSLPCASFRHPRAYQGVVCEQQKQAVAPAAVTDKTWKETVLESDIPVLVDFWAPWCGPCRMIAPLVDELAVQFAGKVKCLKLNTDESPNTATEYGVRSIPTVMIFKQGVKKETIIGAVPKSALVNAIEKFLDK